MIIRFIATDHKNTHFEHPKTAILFLEGWA